LQWKSYIENQLKRNKILKKNYDPTVGLNHAPKNLAGESFINELAGNSVVLV